MTIRETIHQIQAELRSPSDLLPDRAADILVELSSLYGNILDEIRKRDAIYAKRLLDALDIEKTVARAKVVAETSQEFQDKQEAVNLEKVTIQMVRSLKNFLRTKEFEYKL